MRDHPVEQELVAIVFVQLVETDVAAPTTAYFWNRATTAAGSAASTKASRKLRSAKRWASSDRIGGVLRWPVRAPARQIGGSPDGRPVNRRDRRGEAEEGPGRLSEALDAAVGNGNPWPSPVEPSFSRAKGCRKPPSRRFRHGFQKKSGLLEDPLLAAGFEVEDDMGDRREFDEGIHGELISRGQHRRSPDGEGMAAYSGHVVGGLVAAVMVLNFCLYFWT